MGTFANSGEFADAVRPFSGALNVGQMFSIDMDNGYIDAPGGVHVQLRDAANVLRLSISFAGGGTNYQLFDSAFHDTGVGYTDEGLRIDVLVTGANTYSTTLTRRDGVTNTLSGTFFSGGPLTNVRLRNAMAGPSTNGDHDAYFNSMAITPEPSGLALLPLAAAIMRRRRRAG